MARPRKHKVLIDEIFDKLCNKYKWKSINDIPKGYFNLIDDVIKILNNERIK